MKYKLWLRGETWMKGTTEGEWYLYGSYDDLFEAVHEAGHMEQQGWMGWRIEKVT